MRIQRTANAGILLELDGKRILMDGVCEGFGAYLGTPEHLREVLHRQPPDALVYTHTHPDHYDELFVSHYLQNTAGPVLGPADIPCGETGAMQLGNILITPVETRHIGRTNGCDHRSYVLQGSGCVWFMGDASPLHWQKIANVPKPDVIIAPYGFFLGKGWEHCKQSGAKSIVVVHMPLKENDPYELWQALEKILTDQSGPEVFVPAIGETVLL